MNDIETTLTSRQAAKLLDVHESSVKRWCDQQELPFSLTSGGHRRIALKEVLYFASTRRLSCPLLDLRPHEATIWNALLRSPKAQDHEALASLMYEELLKAESQIPARLVSLCHAEDMPVSTLFDSIIGAVLVRMGQAWASGEIDVGDEHRMSEKIIQSLNTLYLNSAGSISSSDDDRPVALVGCNEGSQHDIGARVVRIILAQQGWNAIFLGANVPLEDYAMQQTKFKAELICISLVSPSSSADADRILRVLGRMYDPQHPYRLALGGHGAHGFSCATSEAPMQDCQWFESTTHFRNWLSALF